MIAHAEVHVVCTGFSRKIEARREGVFCRLGGKRMSTARLVGARTCDQLIDYVK